MPNGMEQENSSSVGDRTDRSSAAPDWTRIKSFMAALTQPHISTIKSFTTTIGIFAFIAFLVCAGALVAVRFLMDEHTQAFDQAKEMLGVAMMWIFALFICAGIASSWLDSVTERISRIGTAGSKISTQQEIARNTANILDVEARLESKPSESSDAKVLDAERDRLLTERDTLEFRSKLEHRLEDLSNALRYSLVSTDHERARCANAASRFRFFGQMFLLAAFAWLAGGALLILRPDLLGMTESMIVEIMKSASILGVLVSFPVAVLLVGAGLLLRNDSRLTEEVRHYTLQNQNVELMSGLLSAAQYVDTGDRTQELVSETFRLIRDRLLSSADLGHPSPDSGTATKSAAKEEYPEWPILALVKEINSLRK